MPDDWAFRVASSPEAGAGHMMRCLTIARELSKHYPICFVLDKNEEHWGSLLRMENFKFCTEEKLDERSFYGCLFDGYNFSEQDYLKWKKRSKCLAVIDDLDHDNVQADLIVRPVPHSEKNAIQDPRVLSGFNYAIIDSRFSTSPKPVAKKVERILISFGCIDSNNATSLALKAIEKIHKKVCRPDVTVVMGSQAKYLDIVKEQIKNLPCNIELIIDTNEMPKYVSQSDLIIGAGGISLQERAAAGIPSITIVTSNNQARNVRHVTYAGATIDAGFWDKISIENLASMLEGLINNSKERARMANNGKMLIDGKGVHRIVNALCDLGGLNYE